MVIKLQNAENLEFGIDDLYEIFRTVLNLKYMYI